MSMDKKISNEFFRLDNKINERMNDFGQDLNDYSIQLKNS